MTAKFFGCPNFSDFYGSLPEQNREALSSSLNAYKHKFKGHLWKEHIDISVLPLSRENLSSGCFYQVRLKQTCSA